MERMTREQWGEIECISGCANCCPRSCPHLVTSDLTCDVHPKKLKVSVKEAILRGRGLKCHAKPIELFATGVYCPPIADKLNQLGFNINHHTGSGKVEVIDDFKNVMDKTREIRGLMTET